MVSLKNLQEQVRVGLPPAAHHHPALHARDAHLLSGRIELACHGQVGAIDVLKHHTRAVVNVHCKLVPPRDLPYLVQLAGFGERPHIRYYLGTRRFQIQVSGS